MGRKKKGNVNSRGYYTFKKTISTKFDGTPIKKVFYSKKSKADAQRKAEEYIVKQQLSIQLGETLNPVSVNFKNCAYMWLESVKSSISDVTYNTYETDVRLHLLPYFGKAKIQDIKSIDIQIFFDKFDPQKSRLESVKKYKQVLSAIFQFAKHNDIISRNPCDTVRLSNRFVEPTKHIYTKEENNNNSKEIQQGSTATVSIAYILQDTENPVDITVEEYNIWTKGDYIINKTLDIKK